MKKRIAMLGGIVAAVCVIGGLGWHFWGDSSAKSEDQVYVTTISSLTGSDISGTQNRYAGVVEPQETVEVKLDGQRKVKEVRVQVGQEVKAGDVLFVYDTSTSADDLAQAELDLERYKNEAESYKDQIATLEKEKKDAPEDEQLSYTIQIQSARMDLKKNEYDQKDKAAEIEKLKKAADNTEVISDIDGIIREIDTNQSDASGANTPDMGPGSSDSGSTEAFMTILGTGGYRVKGKINEQNMGSIIQGEPVIIRSRVNPEETWTGTMGSVDMENASSGSSSQEMMFYGGGSSGDEQTTSSTYPFYVNLDTSEGLMLGQHVYIEMDYGQDLAKEGLWLDEYYLVDVDSEPYVWVSGKNDKLEKRKVELGEYDESLGKYQILKGLKEKDCIAFPTEELEEGMTTTVNDDMQLPGDGADSTEDLGPAGAQEVEAIGEGPGEDMEVIDESGDGPIEDPSSIEIVPEGDVQVIEEGVAPE